MWDTLLELYEVYLHNVGHIIMCTHIHVWGTTLLFIVMTLFFKVSSYILKALQNVFFNLNQIQAHNTEAWRAKTPAKQMRSKLQR